MHPHILPSYLFIVSCDVKRKQENGDVVVHEPTIEFAAPMEGGYATAINVRILYL